jgi:lactoylglutathione lyase
MTSGFECLRPEVNPYRTVFNHVGLCVADRERSRRFYEGLLGFEFWWELEPPDDGTDQLLQLAKPVGLRATYLVRDGLVLELLDYSNRELHTGPERVMDQVGLTHLSLSVSDLGAVLTMADGFGGSVVEATVCMIGPSGTPTAATATSFARRRC